MRSKVWAFAACAVVLATAFSVRAVGPDTPKAPPSRAKATAAKTTFVDDFNTSVRPILENICSECHNETTPLNMAAYLAPASLASQRDGWDRILARVAAGEMPPVTVDQPSDAEVTAFISVVQKELDRLDSLARPEPGRVTTRRLNRAEYTNTIRDLLGVDFRATEEFPADDSGYGFDNIGDVLTVSPTLMQKYLAAAEHIAARAVGGEPLPRPGIFTRRNQVRRLDDGVTELKTIVEWDAEYLVRVALTGSRGPEDKPVTVVISIDGKAVKTATVPVAMNLVNRQGGSTQRAIEEVRVFLPANEHTVRAEFINDSDLAKIPVRARGDLKQNIVPEFIEIGGPYPPAAPQTVRKKILTCDPSASSAAGSSASACARSILVSLTRRAYRRPVTTADTAPILSVFDKAKAAGYNAHESLKFAIASVLVSPKFLFRIERDPPKGTIGRLSDVELASRLSYFLWSSMPDDELLKLGETNQLHQPAMLAAQVARMIADPKAAAFSENFVGQWLETRSLDSVRRDQTKYPDWNADLRESMRTETRLFFESVLRENRPISDFIDGNYTFLNGRLAQHYGIAGVEGPHFRRIDLANDQRSGIFTQGSVLTVSSYPTRTSVVLRGKFLLDNLLNAPPPPPPADVPVLDETAVGTTRSLRAQMEAHRTVPLCASCHTKMDPLGFGLENYDAIGRWRNDDGKFPVDATGTLPGGRTFSGPAELKKLLKDRMPDFARGLAEKMLTYALGRGVEPYDRVVLKDLVRQTVADRYRLQTLVQGIVKSVPFQMRRGLDGPRADGAAPAAQTH